MTRRDLMREIRLQDFYPINPAIFVMFSFLIQAVFIAIWAADWNPLLPSAYLVLFLSWWATARWLMRRRIASDLLAIYAYVHRDSDIDWDDLDRSWFETQLELLRTNHNSPLK